MQIFISVIVNIIVLAVVLPLFYVFMVSRVRERLEDEAISRVKEELEALVREFNHSALNNISVLEDAISRARVVEKQLQKTQTSKPKVERIVAEQVISEHREGIKKLNQSISYAKEKEVRCIADAPLDSTVEEVYKSETILSLHKNGISNKEIANAMGCSITEIDLILDLSSKENS